MKYRKLGLLLTDFDFRCLLQKLGNLIQNEGHKIVVKGHTSWPDLNEIRYAGGPLDSDDRKITDILPHLLWVPSQGQGPSLLYNKYVYEGPATNYNLLTMSLKSKFAPQGPKDQFISRVSFYAIF